MSEMLLGKYRLMAELGRGGMAEVFLAVSASSTMDFVKLVVVKKPRAHLADDQEFITMLVDEARIAARLNHPNLVQTLEVGEANGEYFLTMEYLDGQPLHRILNRAREKMPLAMQLGIMQDVLAGLQYAHELKDFDGTPLRIVHRDVTPHNVFVTYDGQVKVVDFGIAKAVGRASETRHGIVKGKRAYMAPEQACGRELDRRVDIFAVGVLLFEAITRQRLWAGVPDVEIVTRLVGNKIPSSPKAIDPTVHDDLDRICRRALAFLPSDRYDTAAAFARDLEAYMAAHMPRPSSRELGEYVAELFADKRRETTAVIEQQLAAMRKATSKVSLAKMPTTTSTSMRASAAPTSLEQATPAGGSQVNGANGASSDKLVALSPESSPSEDQAKTQLMNTTVMPQPRGFGGVAGATGVVAAAVAPPVSPGPFSVPTPPSTGDRVDPNAVPIPRAATATGRATTSTGARAPFQPKRSRAASIVAGLALGLAAAAIGYYVIRAKQRPITQTSTQPPAVQSITVTLRATPLETRFTIDDGPPLDNPFAGSFPKDDRKHQIRASAPGFVMREETATFHDDVSLRFSLARPSHEKNK
jgi:eukaryotic-like serine/threonine-protein kinase